MRVLLITPPMTQLNTPYPATAYLTGFLRQRGYEVDQADATIELALRLFSQAGVADIAAEVAKRRNKKRRSPALTFFHAQKDAILATVDSAVAFLQGKDPSLALRIASGRYLPQGPRMEAALAQFAGEDPLAWAFGMLGLNDRAKFLASLFIDDLADIIKQGVDERFSLSRYGEKLAASTPTFTPLAMALADDSSLIDRYLSELTQSLVEKFQPAVVGFTVPFPGNMYGALRMAQEIKRLNARTTVVLGGGYVNTELRSLKEPRIFDFVDFITLDDGERPLLSILEHLKGKRDPASLLRTFIRDGQQVVFRNSKAEHDIPFKNTGCPTYDGLPLASYFSLLEMLNPMHRIWSDSRWNKLTLAHGCYWKNCNFCDISLDYIGRYEEQQADMIVDKMEALTRETGQSGFHFVDEAAPPKVMLALAERLKERRVQATWWGNIRFEKTFAHPGVAEKLAASGMVAVSGGLEVASDRLLKLMNKGVTVEQVARVTHALTSAGILVHAYLMYAFPTQTLQETIDALERVRQLFAAGCLNSAFWHRFSATIHSPIGKDPGRFGIRLLPMPEVTFAQNDLEFEDPSGVDHEALGVGLKKAVYNFMHGVGLDEDVRFWFDLPVPKAKVPRTLIAQALKTPRHKAVR